MQSNLDLPTLAFFGTLMNMALATMLAVAWGGRRADVHFLYWATSAAWNALNIRLLSEEAAWRGILGAAPFESVMGMTVILLWVGIRRFDHRRIPVPMLVAMIAAPSIAYLIGQPFGLQFFGANLAWLTLVGITAVAILMRQGPGLGRKVAGWAVAANVVTYIVGYVLPQTMPDNPLAVTFSILPYASDSILTILTFFGLMTMASDRHRAELHDLSFTDHLTGALNRRGMIERGDALLRDQTGSVAILLVDLDHFKAINDRHGHAAGDAVLADFVRRARMHLMDRRDFVARYGGEEFVLACVAVDADAARAQAEALRQAIAATPVTWHDEPIPLTVSIGIALSRPGDAGILNAVERADAGLYVAKTHGRNRVVA